MFLEVLNRLARQVFVLASIGIVGCCGSIVDGSPPELTNAGHLEQLVPAIESSIRSRLLSDSPPTDEEVAIFGLILLNQGTADLGEAVSKGRKYIEALKEGIVAHSADDVSVVKVRLGVNPKYAFPELSLPPSVKLTAWARCDILANGICKGSMLVLVVYDINADGNLTDLHLAYYYPLG